MIVEPGQLEALVAMPIDIDWHDMLIFDKRTAVTLTIGRLELCGHLKQVDWGTVAINPPHYALIEAVLVGEPRIISRRSALAKMRRNQ